MFPYIAKIEFCVVIEILPSVLHYVTIENFFVTKKEIFVATEFTLISCFVCCDKKLLCQDKVLLSFIVNSKFYVTIVFSFL